MTYMNRPEYQIDIFCRIGKALTSSLDPEEVFNRVMSLIGEYFGPEYWSLLLMEETTGRLKFEIVMGVDNSKLEGFYLEPGEGIVGWVCRNGMPVVVEDVNDDPRFSPRVDGFLGFKTRSVICVPMLNGKKRVIGAIELVNKLGPGPAINDSAIIHREKDDQWPIFTEMDMAILSAIAAFTGIAAENAFLYQKVRELATVDSLTGLNNRRFFQDALEREVDRSRRYGQKICILMMDIDGLKAINDTRGHMAGDEVLKNMAGILKTSVRESDIVARIGGDEFAILMPLAGQEEGDQLARRIQRLTDRWNMDPDTPDIKIGISIGVQEAGPHDVRDAFLKADRKLYRNKSRRKSAEEITSEDEIRRYLWNNIHASDENGDGTGHKP